MIASTTKSLRSQHDTRAPLGVGATNVLGRLAASFGELNGVTPTFQAALDVPWGGVLFALPALLACGLLSNVEQHFQLPKGYYALQSIFLLLAMMALARLKTVEALRYCAPGEWGTLLGLDRIPEVRTLREKLKHLSQQGHPEAWSAQLCEQWVQAEPQAPSIFYVDGHVRVYHGTQTALPKHHVAREKLCLRATIDYWVNALGGQPFLFINKAVDPGLVKVLEHDIVPRLEAHVPLALDDESLQAEPLRHRLTLIFDREGYSPDFFKRMKAKRIACITYHKHPQGDWPEEEFKTHELSTVAGNVVKTQLAERGTRLSNNLWVRELRRLSDRGHQTAILSTDYGTPLHTVAEEMANRWCQENFFKYMRQHFNLDRLIDYGTEAIPETTRLVNPDYRRLDSEVRRLNAQRCRRLAEFGALQLVSDIAPAAVERYQLNKAALQETIQQLDDELSAVKQQRKDVDRHITFSELPESEQFRQLATPTKHLIDTIKMVAYRAETAMVNSLRQSMARSDDGRTLLRALYQTEADLVPNEQHHTLTVKLHHLANHCSDKSIQQLCEELNATETIFPGTSLKLVYKLGST